VENTVNINLNELAQELKTLRAPSNIYSIGKNQNERTCIVFDGVKWRVYFSERGRMEDLKKFTDFAEAKIEFLKQVTERLPKN
jgi:hypothetical protein